MLHKDVVLWAPRTTVVIFDFLDFDLDVHVVELGMIVKVRILVNVDHCLS